ncbi:MAG: hypothetical protein II166_06120 [Firmicutes bacterium]|nr:hypothetical protein [Bacillota bacterium]
MRNFHSIETAGPESPDARYAEDLLMKKIAAYRIPRSVVKKTGIGSLADVKDPWLIVICTPDTPQSPEVRERIASFTKAGNYGLILTLLLSGAPEESFPRELRFEEKPDGAVVEHEPLAANISASSRRESAGLLSVEMLRLLAPVLGVSFDELRNRRGRSRALTASVIAGAVIIGSLVFLGYALSRMRVISDQNESLSREYELAQEAALRAEEQRDAAREEFAATTAIRAREVLDSGDSELAMLLCLEFLPDSGLSTDLPAVFKDALEGLCAEGYVPVTIPQEYFKTRAPEDGPEESDEGESASSFPKTITMPVPEDYDNGKETFELSLEVSSEEQGFAVYRGSFDISREYSSQVYRSRICFKDDPGRDYYMPFWTEYPAGKWLTGIGILPDGSIIGYIYSYPTRSFYRFDPFKGEFIEFYDETSEGAPGEPAEDHVLSPLILSSDINTIDYFPEVPGLIFGRTRDNTSTDYNLRNEDVKTYVFSADPVRYLTTLEGVVKVWPLPGSEYLLATTGERLEVYRADPFELLYTFEDACTTHLEPSYYYSMPGFPDGRQWMYAEGRTKAVYDLAAGRRLCLIDEPGQDSDMQISSEGLILTSVNDVPTLYRPEDGSVFARIETANDFDPTLFGAWDEETQRRGSEVIRADATMYIYREKAVPVPEDLPGQIALARELLGGRELTRKERKAYDLELE